MPITWTRVDGEAFATPIRSSSFPALTFETWIGSSNDSWSILFGETHQPATASPPVTRSSIAAPSSLRQSS